MSNHVELKEMENPANAGFADVAQDVVDAAKRASMSPAEKNWDVARKVDDTSKPRNFRVSLSFSRRPLWAVSARAARPTT
jgi:hypothetical protein